MLKNYLPFILLSLLFLSGCMQENQTTNDREELNSLLTEFLEGAAFDEAIHDRFWAEDLIYTSSTGERFGKDQIMSGFEDENSAEPDENLPVYHAEDVDIRLHGETAIIAFRLVSTVQEDDETETSYNLNTGTFLKRDGLWQVVAWQSTVE
ncbi:MAG: nuclear transport factor 2 family protein [Balneolaceae bacterium]